MNMSYSMGSMGQKKLEIFYVTKNVCNALQNRLIYIKFDSKINLNLGSDFDIIQSHKSFYTF